MHIILATLAPTVTCFRTSASAQCCAGVGIESPSPAPEAYRERVGALGLAFRPLISARETARMIGHPDLWHPFRSGMMTARWGGPMLLRQYELLFRIGAKRIGFRDR